MKSDIIKKYTVDFVIDFADNYAFTKCKRCFNTKTSREIKQQYKNRCLGYYINRKFYSLTKLRNHLVKPKIGKLPF